MSIEQVRVAIRRRACRSGKRAIGKGAAFNVNEPTFNADFMTLIIEACAR